MQKHEESTEILAVSTAHHKATDKVREDRRVAQEDAKYDDAMRHAREHERKRIEKTK